ncbi:MAG: hypothetical protein HYX63_01450 [Gammaproteobacteria bacterium]|nr:hypothetical protein [Gammaproteobacteria bacterium]
MTMRFPKNQAAYCSLMEELIQVQANVDAALKEMGAAQALIEAGHRQQAAIYAEIERLEIEEDEEDEEIEAALEAAAEGED